VSAALLLASCSSGVTSKEARRLDTSTVPSSTVPSSNKPSSSDTTLATTPDSGPETTPSTSAGSIDWGTCDDPNAVDEALQCATLTVPLDYAAPDGETIELALVRAPATGDRQGAILFNPGGPGGSGFDPIAINGPFIKAEMGLDDFDLIGFDPRGVQRSNGIRCLTDAQFDAFMYVDYTPDNSEEQALVDEEDGLFERECAAKYGDTLRFYSTENTARDMDAIRAGLGDERLSYLGISYGTYLGAVYATMFPERVRAMVLDSAFEPSGDTVEQQFLTQLEGFEGAFDNWAAWCENEPSCAFRADDVGARWDALLAEYDAESVPADDGRLANNAVIERATTAALYAKSEWPVLADALAAAEGGEVAGVFALADAYNGRNPDGTIDTLFQSFVVITCASGINEEEPADPAALLATLKAAAPRFAGDLTVDDLTGNQSQCEELTGDVDQLTLGYDGEGPVVVIGGTNDPATPFRWAEEMDELMGPQSALVRYTGEGHGQLLTSECVTNIEAAVLADLELPDDPTTCEPDPDIAEPTWWQDIPTPDGIDEPTSLPAVSAALGVTPSQFFSETRTTSLGFEQAADVYSAALEEAGFRSLGDGGELGIDASTNRAYFAPDGELLLVVTLGSGAFDSDELASAKPSVPADTTVVLLLHLPQ
jgi:pimeloyl-ACP methyl ester carboxylesterase